MMMRSTGTKYQDQVQGHENTSRFLEKDSSRKLVSEKEHSQLSSVRELRVSDDSKEGKLLS